MSLVDRAVGVAIADSELLAKGFREYRRYRFKLPDEDAALPPRIRDVLCAGRVAAVLPIDLERDEVVLLRQFRFAAHLANGKGELVEIVAGRVEGSEQPIETALRESIEEIGVAPSPLVELFTFLPTPGITDEEITLCLGIVDAAQVPERAGAAAEREETRPLRVPIDTALAALAQGTMRNGVLIIALQWLALNRARLREIVRAASGQRGNSIVRALAP
jgi:ADP-ribose pyrophosphatase